MSDDQVRAGIQRGRIQGSTVIVGDWFMAEAVVPHYMGGYRQTHFTRHAPTVLTRIAEFERELQEVTSDCRRAGVSSRVAAIQTIQDLLCQLTADGT